jgi:hypothetical protein
MVAGSTTQWTLCQRFRTQQNQGFELGCWLQFTASGSYKAHGQYVTLVVRFFVM